MVVTFGGDRLEARHRRLGESLSRALDARDSQAELHSQCDPSSIPSTTSVGSKGSARTASGSMTVTDAAGASVDVRTADRGCA
jgi:hypothetical protein